MSHWISKTQLLGSWLETCPAMWAFPSRWVRHRLPVFPGILPRIYFAWQTWLQLFSKSSPSCAWQNQCTRLISWAFFLSLLTAGFCLLCLLFCFLNFGYNRKTTQTSVQIVLNHSLVLDHTGTGASKAKSHRCRVPTLPDQAVLNLYALFSLQID